MKISVKIVAGLVLGWLVYRMAELRRESWQRDRIEGLRVDTLRWKIASLLNLLPGQCWTDLVMWADGDSARVHPWRPQDGMCRRDAADNGACFCGKLGRDRLPDDTEGVR